jgi:glycosyltransferase involved in cell wall biosynthesis
MGHRHSDTSRVTDGPLLVIASEYVSEWVDKGEVVDRYYNPGERFAEVHLLLTNDDALRPADVQRLVGSARAHVHHLPADRKLFARTLGWRPMLLRPWARQAVELARQIRPALVRCHGAHLNGACAIEFQRALGIPFVASLHTLPGDPAVPRAPWFWPLAEAEAIAAVRDRAIRQADLILAVYASLLPYIERKGAKRAEVVYNALSVQESHVKQNYDLSRPVRAISVGRQIPGKDPSVILEALARLPQVELTLVGDGALSGDVARLAGRLGVESRLKLIPAISNDALVASLGKYDLFLARNDYQGMPKAVLEPMLVGLPVIVNRPTGSVPELSNERCVLVEPTVEGYRSAVERMLADRNARESVGRNARDWAWGALSPQRVEARVAELYDELIGTSTSA